MRLLHLHRIARVVAVHGERRDEDGTVDIELVHFRHHLVSRNMGGPVGRAVPWPAGRVRLVGMDLRIDDGHWYLLRLPESLAATHLFCPGPGRPPGHPRANGRPCPGSPTGARADRCPKAPCARSAI